MEVFCVVKWKVQKDGLKRASAIEIKRQVIDRPTWKKNIVFVGVKVEVESDVQKIFFKNCVMKKLPEGLSETFPNLELISVKNCGLQEISRKDFTGFENLREVLIENNELTTLSGDVFADHAEISRISFKSNKLCHIDVNLIATLPNLKSADFCGNMRINYKFPNSLSTKLHKFGFENDTSPHLKKLEKKIRKMGTFDCIRTGGLQQDIRQFLASDDFRDLTITIDDKKFKVHKFLFTARSPVIRKTLKPETEEMSLQMSVEIFEKILSFIYDETFPSDDDNMLDVYVAAANLEISELKTFTAEKLMESINEDNAFSIFGSAHRFGNNDLKMKAFEHIRSVFPEYDLPDELAECPEDVRKLLASKKEIDKLCKVKRRSENFE